jgi:hypothetical protein
MIVYLIGRVKPPRATFLVRAVFPGKTARIVRKVGRAVSRMAWLSAAVESRWPMGSDRDGGLRTRSRPIDGAVTGFHKIDICSILCAPSFGKAGRGDGTHADILSPPTAGTVDSTRTGM